jgi:hypothetical protein
MKTCTGRDINRTHNKEQPSMSQTSEDRFEAMMRNMERMPLGNRPNPREQDDGPPRNPRRPNIP